VSFGTPGNRTTSRPPTPFFTPTIFHPKILPRGFCRPLKPRGSRTNFLQPVVFPFFFFFFFSLMEKGLMKGGDAHSRLQVRLAPETPLLVDPWMSSLLHLVSRKGTFCWPRFPPRRPPISPRRTEPLFIYSSFSPRCDPR